MKQGGTARLSILGGGPAGLAAGYYARKKRIPFTIYEQAGEVGGNARTIRHGDFLFDTGAHRWHDQDPGITREVLHLMGDDIRRVEAPSQTYHRGKFIDFPLSPLNLFLTLGPIDFMEAGMDLLRSRATNRGGKADFESFAIKTYGRSIASRFLLGYSEKLWGAPCHRLSPLIAGKRLKGLNLKTFLTEAVLGRRAKTEHLDGSFYYPIYGIGMISERLARAAGLENIRTRSAVTAIFHNGKCLLEVEINGAERVSVDSVVSTLPGPLFLKLMRPAPPEAVLSAARGLRFRNLRLVVLFINKKRIGPNASVYFPDSEVPFTRVYEPKNRSERMAPDGKTSLVAEVPCQPEDELWRMEDSELIRRVSAKFTAIGWVKPTEVLDGLTYRIASAYPIIELGSEEKSSVVMNYLSLFENLSVSGRSGRFMYTHLHDMMRLGKDIIDNLKDQPDLSVA